MNPFVQSSKYPDSSQVRISHYRLDFQCNGSRHYYIWRHNPLEDGGQSVPRMLIDLNHVYVPDQEIEKMVFGFVVPASGILSIAFINCHVHNQQDIKRKLKMGDVKLYSKTAFFTDLHKARQWLKAQCVSC